MAETLYLRDSAGNSCGPGTRKALTAGQGSGADTMSLDSTGDTWNKVYTAVNGTVQESGTWSANLYLRANFLGSEASVELAHYSPVCSEIEGIFKITLPIATSGSFSLYTFSASVGQMIFGNLDLLLCIVTEEAGDVVIEYDQPGFGNVSLIQTPDIRTVRPHYYYQRNARRRSA